MKVPGFTADASLYRSTKHYVRRVTGVPTLNAVAVVPQLRQTFDIGGDCTLFCDCNLASGSCFCDATLCPVSPFLLNSRL